MKRYIFYFLISFSLVPFFFEVAIAGHHWAELKTPEEYYKLGEEFLHKKDYGESSKYFNIAYQFSIYDSQVEPYRSKLKRSYLKRVHEAESPNEAYAAFVSQGLALCSVRHEFKEADKLFDKAIDYKHDYAGAYLAKGVSLMMSLEQKQVAASSKEILKLYDTALKFDPNYTSVYLAKGNLYMDYLHDYEAALKQYRIAQEIEPGNPAYYHALATVLDRLGRLDEAAKMRIQIHHLFDSKKETQLSTEQ